MPDSRKKFIREPADQRKSDLIEATLRVIANLGMHACTVRKISEEANVTQGLIRHYFMTKEDLICAAYEAHLSAMTQRAREAVDLETRSAQARLATYITTSLIRPVAGPDPLGVWAGFLPLIRHEKEIFEVHRRTNQEFRDYLQELIAAVWKQLGTPAQPQALRQQTLVCGCIIDGIWLEAGLFPDAIDTAELPRLALKTVGAALNLPQLADEGIVEG